MSQSNRISLEVHGMPNVKEDWMTARLVETWDRLHNHLTKQYDLSKIDRVLIDTIVDDSAGVHYRTSPDTSTIVISPYVFHLTWMQTSYTKQMLEGEVLLFTLLHETCHYLQATNQIQAEEDREIQADNFAFKTLKEANVLREH